MRHNGRYGDYGGMYVPQILFPALEQLEEAFYHAIDDQTFIQELNDLLDHFAGRPTPLFEAKNLSNETVRIFLKREDLVHGGAHKTNQALAQALLAKRMGKTRLIAETGAGQHGVATAMVGALLGLDVVVYMGAKDVERQQPNVQRMKLLGARVHAVAYGQQTLKYAINEALKDWAQNYENTHYLIGSAVGPHPFPQIVKTFQSVIGTEAKEQILNQIGKLPNKVIACVNGGSNALGIFSAFLEDTSVELIGIEPGGTGENLGEHGATVTYGKPGILHGAKSTLLQTEHGQVAPTHSIAAGLDYPAVGPELAHLASIGRVHFKTIKDCEALEAFTLLCQKEGIIPAIESSHALAYALKISKTIKEPCNLIVNLSGRGDKDLNTIQRSQHESV